MTTIEAQVPDYLARLAHEAAEKENVSVDQIVAVALAKRLGVAEDANDQGRLPAKSERFPSPQLAYDEDDLVNWDVEFTPPPAPLTQVKGAVKFAGWAPVPNWSEEDLEADQE
jgi:hypothetical protein